MYIQENIRSQRKNELELRRILRGLWDNALLIVLSGILLGLVLILFTKLFIPPEYEAGTKFFVLSRHSQTTVSISDMESSASLTQDYIEVIRSRTVLERTISELGLDMSYEELLKEVTATATIDTSIISISVTAEDPYLVAEIADKISDISMEVIRQVMEVETIHVIEPAEIPDSPEGPSLARNGVVGGMTGILLSMLVVIWRTLIDNALWDSNDVRYYLGLDTLGSIPFIGNDTVKTNKARRKRRKHAKKNII